MPYRLEAGETISEGVSRLLLERVDQIIDDLTSPEKERDIAVHDSRKNCKRIRAAYRLIRDEIGVELYRQENIRFRDTARLLAGARDSWVMIQTLNKLVALNENKIPRQAFNGIQQKLLERYETQMAGELEIQTTNLAIIATMKEARIQIEGLPIERQDFSAFHRGVRRVYARGRKAMRLAYEQPSFDVFHEWRKRTKYLWHQLEILESLWPNVIAKLVDELHLLSDYLGDDHDLAVLRSTILEESAGFLNENELLLLVQLIDKKRLELEALARPLGERLYFDSPQLFTQRLETYWQAWKSEHEGRQAELIENIVDLSAVYFCANQNLLTTSELAANLAISPQKVRKLIYDQKIPAEKVGKIWVIRTDISLSKSVRLDEALIIGGLLSTQEVAHHLRITPEMVRNYIQTGVLPALKMGRQWIILEKDLENFRMNYRYDAD